MQTRLSNPPAALVLGVLLLTVVATEARSLAASRSDAATSSPPVGPLPPAAKQTVSSHLLFYLTVEKELVPQTKGLAARALHILQLKCSEFYNRTSDCLLEADQLPPIPALGDFPSDGALGREGSKVFSKHLLKDVYRVLVKLQVLLEEENEGIEPLTQLILHMDRTRSQIRRQMDLFYKAQLRERDSYVNLPKSKKRYTRRSRLYDDDCWNDDDNNNNDDDNAADEDKDANDDGDKDSACLTEDQYRLRLLYSAYRQLLRVHHVLGYTVRLSWLDLEEDRWP